MPRVITVSRLTQSGKFSKLAIQGAGLDATIHHSNGEFYMLSGKGSKSRPNEIVGAARAFIASEALASETPAPANVETPDDRRQTLTPAAPVQASPVFAELAVIIEAQTAYYRHYVAMSDAMADRGDVYGHAESLRHAVYAADTLAFMQRLAADPAFYDFSELSGVTA